jgi:8-oxo-dGTP pyrophosphatase MutT (NUDIX family)
LEKNTTHDLSSDDTADWQCLHSKKVFDTPWISVFDEQVINPNGGKGIYGRVHFKNVAIGILPIDDEGYTWLVGQKRYPIDAYTWEIPEGGAPLHEDPLDAAKRELQEEIQMEADYWEKIAEVDLSNSATDERAVIYVAKNLRPATDTLALDSTEKISVKRVLLEDFFRMVDEGLIRDSLSVLAALRYRVK